MKLLFLFLFSILFKELYAASCCVSNTSVSNLMILPAKWQETITLSHAKVIGDVDQNGESTFRSKENREITQLAKVDLAYGWTSRYQTGISVKYQNKSRDFNGEESSDSGWSDLGLSHAFQIKKHERIWIYQIVNIPTATSLYESNANYAVDAHGSGTFLAGLGFFGIKNFTEWDMTFNGEVHHSFQRTFRANNSKTRVGSFWGSSVGVGVGYIPWRSKTRVGINLAPRLESSKDVVTNGKTTRSKESLVWDSSVNVTYSLNAEFSLGLNYLDQTIFGPAKNTLLNRSLSALFQIRWP